ncbi:MAG: peptidoglycan editing factor PgeF [Muribaculaceae bacterium]|nr:peptidoglycan editing factor PgeF [Muribaculaceae bacterium]
MQEAKIANKILFDNHTVIVSVLAPETNGEDTEKVDQFYRHTAVIPQQTHSVNVGIVSNMSDEFPDTDALITFIPDLTIGVRTADCVPIIIHAPDIKAVAAIHAGWKGTFKGIVDETITVLNSYGGITSEMIAIFGPSISQEIYEVDHSLADMFKEKGFTDYISFPKGKNNKPHLDLQGINMERLLRRGVQRKNIQPSSFCTYLSTIDNKPLFQSYRRDGIAAGRNLTMVRLR